MEDKTSGSGTMDKIKGKTNEAVGRMTGDKSQEWKGKAQNAMGNVKDAARDAKDAITDKE